MYTSTEDARSDLFLSGAVYVIGPAVFQIVRNLLRLDLLPGVTSLLELVIPVATTALVPYLLMRYRGESFGQFGYGAGLPPNFGVGLLLALPIVVASVVTGVVITGGDPRAGLGITALLVGQPLAFLARLLSWVGLGFLAVYATVKARDAFRSDYRTVREETITIGRILAMVAVAGVSIALLLTRPDAVGMAGGELFAAIVLPPLGVAGSVGLLFPLLRGPSATSRATMLTPVVLLALGPFQLSFSLTGIALSVSRAAAYAGVGLVIAALQESRRSAVAILGLTLAIALLSTL
jgi:hypothetical protein